MCKNDTKWHYVTVKCSLITTWDFRQYHSFLKYSFLSCCFQEQYYNFILLLNICLFFKYLLIFQILYTDVYLMSWFPIYMEFGEGDLIHASILASIRSRGAVITPLWCKHHSPPTTMWGSLLEIAHLKQSWGKWSPLTCNFAHWQACTAIHKTL